MELEPGVEGLVHVSEMSWTKKNVHPGKIVATSQEVDVMILDVDEPKRRISLGLKQAQGNPWEVFPEAHPPGTVIEGEIRNITEFGLFIGLGPDIDGMVHMSDLSWDEPGEAAMANFKKGDIVKAKVLDVDVEKERISLGIKQLEADPAAEVLDKVRKGDVVTCIVTKVQANGIEVKVDDVLTGFIRRAELARDRGDQRPDKFAVGEKVDAKVTAVDRAARRLSLTIKGKEIEEEREAMKELRLDRQRRLARRHPGRGDPPPPRDGRRGIGSPRPVRGGWQATRAGGGNLAGLHARATAISQGVAQGHGDVMEAAGFVTPWPSAQGLRIPRRGSGRTQARPTRTKGRKPCFVASPRVSPC